MRLARHVLPMWARWQREGLRARFSGPGLVSLGWAFRSAIEGMWDEPSSLCAEAITWLLRP